jgi:hypothetical protein
VGYLTLLVLMALAACSAPQPGADSRDVAELAAAIRALGPEVSAEEAGRAAHIAFAYSAQLAQEYQITDPPLIHNTKVNMGLRPRGLCWHWAEDMEKRLTQEAFETLDLHRAIANSQNPLRIEHSTTIVSRRGDDMFSGIVVDPWRKGGRLTWKQTRADTDYKWLPQRQVLIAKQERRARRNGN